MKIRFTPSALAEFRDLLNYLEARSPQGARNVNDRIEVLLRRLQAHPLIGTGTNLQAMRRLPVTPYPYLIFYLVTDDEVVVVGIRHAARNPETMPDQS